MGNIPEGVPELLIVYQVISERPQRPNLLEGVGDTNYLLVKEAIRTEDACLHLARKIFSEANSAGDFP